jgi:hypothetical protein
VELVRIIGLLRPRFKGQSTASAVRDFWLLRVLVRRQMTERAMRPALIVIDPPRFDFRLRILDSTLVITFTSSNSALFHRPAAPVRAMSGFFRFLRRYTAKATHTL